MATRPLLDRVSSDDLVVERVLLEAIDRFPFFHAISGASRPRTKFEDRELINLGSNNYLGLADDAVVKDAATDAIARYGTGTTGSRLLNGSTKLHEMLERDLAAFFSAEAAIVYSTGYGANLGLLSALLRRGDVVVLDEDVHASLYDGVRLSGAKQLRFRHNDPEHLDELLRRVDGRPSAVVIDGIYSMRGDAAPVAALAEVAHRHGATLIDDEAHGLGVCGRSGAGAAEEQGVLDVVDLTTITFSKSLGSCGGAVIGPRSVIEYLKVASRPFLFTASNTPGSVGAASAALHLLQAHPEWPAEVRERAEELKTALAGVGVLAGSTDSAILTVRTGGDLATLHAWRLLWNRGVFCNAVVSPAVPPGQGLLRLSVMRTHTSEDIAEAVTAFAQLDEVLTA